MSENRGKQSGIDKLVNGYKPRPVKHFIERILLASFYMFAGGAATYLIMQEKIDKILAERTKLEDKVIEFDSTYVKKPKEIIKPKEPKGLKEPKKKGNIILDGEKLEVLTFGALADGIYTKLPLIDIATEVFKEYHKNRGFKKGRHIIVYKKNLESPLKNLRNQYMKKDLDMTTSTLKDFKSITLSYSKPRKRYWFKIDLKESSTQEIPKCWGSEIKYDSKEIVGYIKSYNLKKGKEKIRMRLYKGDIEFLPSEKVKIIKLGKIRDLKIREIELEQKGKHYLGRLYGTDKKDRKIGIECNITTFAKLSVKPVPYN